MQWKLFFRIVCCSNFFNLKLKWCPLLKTPSCEMAFKTDLQKPRENGVICVFIQLLNCCCNMEQEMAAFREMPKH